MNHEGGLPVRNLALVFVSAFIPVLASFGAVPDKGRISEIASDAGECMLFQCETDVIFACD